MVVHTYIYIILVLGIMVKYYKNMKSKTSAGSNLNE